MSDWQKALQTEALEAGGDEAKAAKTLLFREKTQAKI